MNGTMRLLVVSAGGFVLGVTVILGALFSASTRSQEFPRDRMQDMLSGSVCMLGLAAAGYLFTLLI